METYNHQTGPFVVTVIDGSLSPIKEDGCYELDNLPHGSESTARVIVRTLRLMQGKRWTEKELIGQIETILWSHDKMNSDPDFFRIGPYAPTEKTS